MDQNSSEMLVPLLGMVGELGELLAEYKKWLRDGQAYALFPDRAREELGDLLWYLSNTATKVRTFAGRSWPLQPKKDGEPVADQGN